MFHIVYKVTNLLSGKFYIGVHSTEKLDDKYLGSGKLIKQAIRKYGAENFSREILSTWETRELALIEETRLVDPTAANCYNLMIGGGSPPTYRGIDHPLYGSRRLDSVERMTNSNPAKLPHVRKMLAETMVGTLNGKNGRFERNDPRWITGEIVHVNKGMIPVKTSEGVFMKVTRDDPRWLSGELKHMTTGNPRTIAQMTKELHVCPHCGLEGRGGSMKRWHFDNCKGKS